MYSLPRYFLSRRGTDVVPFRPFLQFSTVHREKTPSSNTTTSDLVVDTCGEKSMKALPCFPHKISSENVESVLKFLKERGFDDTQVKSLVFQMPRLLLSGVDTSLKPKFKFLEELGFSRRDIVRLVIKGPVILSLSLENHLRPSVDFLRTQLGSDLDLPKAIKKSWRLLSMNLHKTGLPHIELLRSHGVDDKQIQKLFLLEPYLFLVNVTVLENLISRIEMLNAKFLPGMLIYALHSLRRVSVERFEAKCKLWKSFGLSDEDIVSAFEKFPSFVTISEEKFRCLMDFLVNDVGFEPKQIAANTFGMSLAKRIRPRYEILKILQKWGEWQGKVTLTVIAYMPTRTFIQHFVAPYIHKIPELEAYISQLKTQSSPTSKWS